MFEIAFFIGIFSYMIFFLGILGLLYKNIIILITIGYLLLIFLAFRNKLAIKIGFKNIGFISKALIFIIFLQLFINLIGVLGPELSFDALWYHLTLPKIFLENHKIFHIPGGLLYYSDIPKNIEMIYLALFSFGNEILIKFSHFLFGLLTLLVTFKIARKFVNLELSLISCIIFYSSLVVGWESISAYVDLGTTFFVAVSLYCFLEYIDKKNIKFLFFSAVITGFCIATKSVALNLIPIYLILILFLGIKEKYANVKIFHQLLLFFTTSVILGSVWFTFSFLNTGNSFYPLFDSKIAIVNNVSIKQLFTVFLFSQDPINPAYLIFLPLVLYYFLRFNFKMKLIFVFFILGLLFWVLDSEIGGSRFILPYLPAMSVVIVYSINLIKDKQIKNISYLIVIFLALISIFYRSVANYKFLPVVLGMQSKQQFLSKHLNFKFGDFYDTDGYFKNHIKPTDKVLLYGFHNLYYVDFPFIDSTFVKEGDKYNYIAVQNEKLPTKFSNFKEEYYNSLTGVKLYSLKN